MNSKLVDKEYKIPIEIINSIRSEIMKNPKSNGVKRGKYILNNQVLTYQAMKRIKHDMENLNLSDIDDNLQYKLGGGDNMLKFINTTLNNDRKSVEIKNNIDRDIKPNLTKELNENQFIIDVNLKNNVIAVIINNDNQILLAKRNSKCNWGADKYAFIGGKIEEGETPKIACLREVWEETGLVIPNIKESFVIKKEPNYVNFVFVCRYCGDSDDVELNDEHSSYGWFTIKEIDFIDTVPTILTYLKIIFKEE